MVVMMIMMMIGDDDTDDDDDDDDHQKPDITLRNLISLAHHHLLTSLVRTQYANSM